MINILIIDDKFSRFRLMKSALFEEKVDDNKTLFPKESFRCYPTTDNEANSFCADVAMYAEKQDILNLFLYLYKYIDEHNISCIFTDRSFNDKTELDTGKIASGDRIAFNLLKNSIYKTMPIVIYSRKEESDDVLLNKVPYADYIEFDSTASVESYMDEVLATLGNNKQSMKGFHKRIQYFIDNKPYKVDLMIICALDREYKYIRDIFSPSVEHYYEDIHYETGYIFTKDNRILKVFMTNMKGDLFEKREKGREAAIKRAEHFIKQFKPKYLLMTGVAAGFETKGVLKGDIIIATSSHQWDFGRTDNGKDNASSDPIEIKGTINRVLKNRFDNECANIINEEYLKEYLDIYDKNFSKIIDKEVHKPYDNTSAMHKGKFTIHQGMITSGNRVIADDNEIVRILKVNSDAIGLDMEIDAIYKVGKDAEITFLAIKGVVDYGGDNKDKKWQDFSSYTSAKLMYKLFTEYIDMESE